MSLLRLTIAFWMNTLYLIKEIFYQKSCTAHHIFCIASGTIPPISVDIQNNWRGLQPGNKGTSITLLPLFLSPDSDKWITLWEVKSEGNLIFLLLCSRYAACFLWIIIQAYLYCNKRQKNRSYLSWKLV